MSTHAFPRALFGIATLGVALALGSHEASAGGKPPVDVANSTWLLLNGDVQLSVKKLGKYKEAGAAALFHFDPLAPEAEPGTLPEFYVADAEPLLGEGRGAGVAALFGGVYEVKGSKVTLLTDAEELGAFILLLLQELQAEGAFESEDEIVFQSVEITKTKGYGNVKEKPEEPRTMKAQLKASFILTGTVNGEPAATKGSFSFKSKEGTEQTNGGPV